MNIFNNIKKEILEIVERNKKKLKFNDNLQTDNIQVELAPIKFDCDISTNLAMILAKTQKKNALSLASDLKKLLLSNIKEFDKIDIAGSGFLNITLKNSSILKIIQKILSNKKNYGSHKSNKNINIEFVSANPTGPLHVGHCRGAILGDVIANLLLFNKNKVTKEYYVNDYGNQINNFVKSVYLRIREIKYGETFVLEEDLYPGDYIIDIAKYIIDKTKKEFKSYDQSFDIIRLHSLNYSLKEIKKDLKELGISHDIYISESELVKKKLVEKSVEKLKKNKLIVEGYLNPPKGEEKKNWKKTKRLIFKSSLFGDDQDRALQKDDGSWTYFANDLAYHNDKIIRKFDILINILGADHTGYIKRISAAVKAISNNKTNLFCKVSQLVKLFKDGKPFKMSKRAGEFITLKDLQKEVSKDSIRFMMLNRSNDMELDFDFNKVIEKTKDNPVFYVQYAKARINSIFRIIKKDINSEFKINDKNFQLNSFEKKIIRKVFEWPNVIEVASKRYEPHRLTFYLYELSTLFHTYWSKGNEDDEFKIIKNNNNYENSSIIILQLLSTVIDNGMNILGVSLPDKM